MNYDVKTRFTRNFPLNSRWNGNSGWGDRFAQDYMAHHVGLSFQTNNLSQFRLAELAPTFPRHVLGGAICIECAESILALHGLFHQGAFQGQISRDAYFVKCDSTTMIEADIKAGVVTVLIGFAPLKPAEFLVLKLKVSAAAPTDRD